MVIIALSVFLFACCSQSQGQAQNLGGDYGRTWLNNFNIQNPKPVADNGNGNSNDLWNWGGAPKGRIAVNGKLVQDPYYFWKSLNYTSGWLGQVYVDPKTRYPIYGFIDPYTGSPVYFYVNPNTGQPVFTNSGLNGGYPYYDSASPYYWSNFGMPTSTNYPWLGAPSFPYSSTPSYDYLSGGPVYL